jgi:hypothetical protein
MFAAIIFAVSLAGLSQFALFYWRAVIVGVAAQPCSNQILEAANVENGHLNGRDFDRLAGLHELTLELNPTPGGLGLVRVYYGLVNGLDRIAGKLLPDLSAWSDRERTLCAQYAAVKIHRRMQANVEMAAFVRSC